MGTNAHVPTCANKSPSERVFFLDHGRWPGKNEYPRDLYFEDGSGI